MSDKEMADFGVLSSFGVVIGVFGGIVQWQWLK